MIELHLLKQLNAFARIGTLTGASKELHISQPALTRSMKKIEEETGMSLFNREGRKISLNEGGKIAAKYAARILDEENEMIRELSSWNRRLNTVTVGGCVPIPVFKLMPALQRQFSGKSIVTEICEHNQILVDRLKAGDLQIIILHDMPKVSGVFSQPYFKENICLYVPKSHPLAKRKSVTLEESAQYSVLIHRNIGFWLPICQKAFPASNLLIQDSMDAMDELAETSTTAMFNSNVMIKEGYVTEGRIAVPITDDCMTTTYYVACLDSQKKELRSLFDAVRAEALKEFS